MDLVLPKADRDCLEAIYSRAMAGRPMEMWALEEEFGADPMHRLFAASLILVEPSQLVSPKYSAAVVLETTEVATVATVLLALRDAARRLSSGMLSVAELAAETGRDADQIRRALRVLPPVPGPEVRVQRPGPPELVDFTAELKRWDAQPPTSVVPYLVELWQVPAFFEYGIREFHRVVRGHRRPPVALELRGVTITDSALDGALLEGADLSEARFERVDLRGACLAGASLAGAVLSDVSLGDGYGSGADLRRATLDKAALENVSLVGVNAAYASFRGTTLRRCLFRPRDAAGAVLDDMRVEDHSGIDLVALADQTTWSVVHLDGHHIYPSGCEPLELIERPLGWTVRIQGVDRGAVSTKGCGPLAALIESGGVELHLLELVVLTMGATRRRSPSGPLSDDQLSSLLCEAGLPEVAEADRWRRLDERGRWRLAAVAELLESTREQLRGGMSQSDIDELREQVRSRLGPDGPGGLPCDGALDQIRKRLVSQLGTALSAIAKGDPTLRAALDRAFQLREACTYHREPLFALEYPRTAAGESSARPC